jgi:hypothetical protein
MRSSTCEARPNYLDIKLRGNGKALITRVFAEHERAMERAMIGLSKAERARLTDLLRRLGMAAEELLAKDSRAPAGDHW